MEIKKAQIHFLGEVSAAVVVTWSRGMGCRLFRPKLSRTQSVV